MRSSFSDKGVKLIPACFRVPEFGNWPESRRAGRWRAGLFFVSWCLCGYLSSYNCLIGIELNNFFPWRIRPDHFVWPFGAQVSFSSLKIFALLAKKDIWMCNIVARHWGDVAVKCKLLCGNLLYTAKSKPGGAVDGILRAPATGNPHKCCGP